MASLGVSAPVDFSKPINKATVKGKTALVTGGASGMGAGITRALAEAGVRVTIADINNENGKMYAAALKSEGLSVEFARTDVSNWQSQVDAFKQCIRSSANDTVDIVLACAGLTVKSIFQDGPFTSTDKGEDPKPPSLDVFNVNLIGAFYTALLAIHYFRETAKSPEEFAKADKQFIVIASNIAYYPLSLASVYSASKAGVRALWKTIRTSPDLTGMRTNLVAPHLVRTPMTAELEPFMDANGIGMMDVSEVVDVLMRIVCDGSIKGRAVGVNPGNPFDLCDDLEDYDGAREFGKRHATATAPVFDFLTPLLRMGVQPGGQQA